MKKIKGPIWYSVQPTPTNPPHQITGNFFYKYVTFRLIFKKSYQEGVFEILPPDPQLVQISKPSRNLSGHFIYYLFK